LKDGRQQYCGRPACQRARRATWKRKKLADDPDYRSNHNDANRAWRANHPGYWREYRRTHFEHAERNRQLQRIRRRSPTQSQSGTLTSSSGELANVAKVDASKNAEVAQQKGKYGGFRGDFWLIPTVAKVDALRVRIVEIVGG